MKILKRNCEEKQFPSKTKPRDCTISFGGRDYPSAGGGGSSVLTISPSSWGSVEGGAEGDELLS